MGISAWLRRPWWPGALHRALPHTGVVGMVSGMAWGAARPATSVRVGAKIRQVGCRKTPGCQQHSRDGDKAKGASFTPTRVPGVEEAGEEGKCKMDSQRQAVGYWEGFPIFCPTIHTNLNPKPPPPPPPEK